MSGGELADAAWSDPWAGITLCAGRTLRAEPEAVSARVAVPPQEAVRMHSEGGQCVHAWLEPVVQREVAGPEAWWSDTAVRLCPAAVASPQ